MEPDGTPRPDAPGATQDGALDEMQRLADRRATGGALSGATSGASTGAVSGARVTRKIEVASVREDDAPPSVERAAWLRDDDYWRKVTYMSATGRHPGVQPSTRPLPRPDRFAARSPLRSLMILALVVALIILIPIGVVTAAREASKLILPANFPGISQPTEVPPTHTPGPKPTATPQHKK
jgi:hypothetical protein